MFRKFLTALLTALALTAVLAPSAHADREYYLSYHGPTTTPREGNLLIIHGGGWKGDLGAEADQVMSTYIADARGWGYGTYNIGYRSGEASVRDVIDAGRRIARKNPEEPFCMVGGSAGAHLALIAATKLRRDLDCVVDIGGPPDLVHPDTQPLSGAVVELAREAFGGVGRLLRLSPINRIEEIRQPVLVVAPDCDHFTSLERQAAFAAALRRGELIRVNGVKKNVLSPLLQVLGSIFDFGFGSHDPGVETGHCAVSTESFDAFRAAERAFLDRNMR